MVAITLLLALALTAGIVLAITSISPRLDIVDRLSHIILSLLLTMVGTFGLTFIHLTSNVIK